MQKEYGHILLIIKVMACDLLPTVRQETVLRWRTSHISYPSDRFETLNYCRLLDICTIQPTLYFKF